MDAEQLAERRKRQAQGANRSQIIGIDSTGAEYWLVPYPKGSAANRQFEVRNSKKQVPVELMGMWTDAASALRAFEAWQDGLKSKKRSTSKDK